MGRRLFAVLFALSCATTAHGKDPEIERSIATYEANQARFHAQYRGKPFDGVGTVVSIRTDVLGIGLAYFVLLNVNNSHVLCDTESRDIAASLDKGQRVRFTGRIHDVALGVLRISDCAFEASAAALERQQRESQYSQEIQLRANKIRNDRKLMAELRRLSPLSEVLDEMIDKDPDSVSSVEAARKWELVLKHDLTGDGILDHIFVNRASKYCGTGGCATFIFVSQKGRPVLAFQDATLGVGISSKRSVPPIVEIGAHRGFCNHEVLDCKSEMKWDGREFREIPRR